MSVTFPEALHPLVQQVQTHVYVRPALAIEAARQLLRQCRLPEHLAYVYEQLGFAHLILGEHRLSCLFYEQARALQPDNMYVLANLAHARYELGEREEAVQIGREALRLKDELACREAGPLNALLEPPHHGPINLISFSLYGHQPRYGEMAVLNVLAARRHLPDFVCRFYLDDSVPPALVNRLQHLGAQCVHVGAEGANVPATFWRFGAMDDPQADCVLVRDVDALIDAREAWCVQDWRESGLPLHIIRDDCCHTELILAGLLGIRSGVLRGMAARIAQYLMAAGEAGHGRYADQLFLRHAVWPALRNHALTHDTVYGYGSQVHALDHPPKTGQGPRNSFIGANHASCRIQCQLQQPLPPGALLHLTVRSASGELICRHAMQQVRSDKLSPSSLVTEWDIHLPLIYAPALQSGQWTYDITLQADGLAGLGEGSIDPLLLGIDPG